MSHCPHCHVYYDEDNDSQPCCGGCGHPITCGCSSDDWQTFNIADEGKKHISQSRKNDEDDDFARAVYFIGQTAVHQVFELYHMTSIDNLGSICNFGLLSHNSAHSRDLTRRDISMNDVQNLRHQITVAGRPLHDYVCLYFSPRNPMLYKRKDLQNEIVILSVNVDVLGRSNTYFTDGNAAANKTCFYQDLEDLDRLPWDVINGTSWLDYPDGRRKKCAEVLVYPCVDLADITYIYCVNEDQKLKVNGIVTGRKPVITRPELYF